MAAERDWSVDGFLGEVRQWIGGDGVGGDGIGGDGIGGDGVGGDGVGGDGLERLFVPYAKIKDAFDGDAKAARKLRKLTFVATEKVHGANMQLLCDGERVVAAKRRAVLGPDEPFFGLIRTQLIDVLAERARSVAAAILPEFPDATAVSVCGELAGGSPPVQTGIFYGPELLFFVFDLAVLRGPGDATFLPFDAAMAAADAAGFLVAEPLARGPMGKLSDMPLDFPSTIPRRLGLEVPPSFGDNTAEGIVIRPATAAARVLIKAKGVGFAEVEAKGHGHMAQVRAAPSSSGTGPEIEAWELVWFEVQCFVTPMRMAGARGKLGSGASDAAVISLAVADALADWCAHDFDARTAWIGLGRWGQQQLIERAAGVLGLEPRYR